MSQSSPEELERAVLKDAGWVQQIAREFLRDPTSAEDLSQDVLTAALAHGPEWAPRKRAWLRSVMRNLALRRISREQARPDVERRAARAEAVEMSEERIELQEHLTRALSELDEPYRTVVVMRFFDGLSHAAIGDRLGLQASAVRKRLSRALSALRTTLQRRLKLDADEWRSAMARLACPLPRAGAAPAWSRMLPAAALSVVAAVAVWKWLPDGGEHTPSEIVLHTITGSGEALAEARVDYIAAGEHAVATTDAAGRVRVPGSTTRVMITGSNRAPLVFALGPDPEQELSVASEYDFLARLSIDGQPPSQAIEMKLAVSLADLQLGQMAQYCSEWGDGSEVLLRTKTIPDGGFMFLGIPPDARMQLVLPDGLRAEYATDGVLLDGGRSVYFDGLYRPVLITATTRDG